MLPRALEVAAITGGVALIAGVTTLVEHRAGGRAIPAIVGAAVVAGLVFYRRTHAWRIALLSALLSGLAAFALDWFFLFALGHGYPSLKAFRSGPIYQASVVILFGALALLDVASIRTASDAAAARP